MRRESERERERERERASVPAAPPALSVLDQLDASIVGDLEAAVASGSRARRRSRAAVSGAGVAVVVRDVAAEALNTANKQTSKQTNKQRSFVQSAHAFRAGTRALTHIDRDGGPGVAALRLRVVCGRFEVSARREDTSPLRCAHRRVRSAAYPKQHRRHHTRPDRGCCHRLCV